MVNEIIWKSILVAVNWAQLRCFILCGTSTNRAAHTHPWQGHLSSHAAVCSVGLTLQKNHFKDKWVNRPHNPHSTLIVNKDTSIYIISLPFFLSCMHRCVCNGQFVWMSSKDHTQLWQLVLYINTHSPWTHCFFFYIHCFFCHIFP